MVHQDQRSQADAATSVQSDVVSSDTPTRIPSDRQYLLERAKPLLEALRIQIEAEEAQRGKPLSRKVLTSRVRGEIEREEQQRRAAERQVAAPQVVIRQQLTREQKQAEDKARKQAVEEQRQAVIKAVTERVDAILAQQHLDEIARKQAIEAQRAAIMEQVRLNSVDELRELAQQREIERDRILALRKAEKTKPLAVQSEPSIIPVVTKQKRVRIAPPEKAKIKKTRSFIQSEAAFLAEKAAPILEQALAEGKFISKTALMRQLRIDHSADLQLLDQQRKAAKELRKKLKPVVVVAPVVQPAVSVTAQEAATGKKKRKRKNKIKVPVVVEAVKKAKSKKARQLSEFEILKGKANAIAAEAAKRGETVNKSQIMRELQAQVAAELEQRRAEAERKAAEKQAKRAQRVTKDQPRVRHAFERVAAVAVEPKKTDKRRLRREQRALEAAAEQAVPVPHYGSAAEYISAAREQLASKQRNSAARLLTTAADSLSPQDPMRFELAAVMGKAISAAKAAEVVQPLLGHEHHSEKAEVMLATFQLAQGQSRIAFDMLTRGDRSSIKPMQAAAQLSWAIRTDDADGCAQALAKLELAKFSNKGQVLNIDLSAYPNMPAQARLCAGTLKYANCLGEALMVAGRLHEAVKIYDTLAPVRPTCSDERRDFIRALKSCGEAYYQFGFANRKALGELSVPHSATVAWSEQAERITLAETADKYLNKSFARLFAAFELHGTDETLRENLAKVVTLTGNPRQFEQVNERVHRRQKAVTAMLEAPDSTALLERMQHMSTREELSKDETRLLRELQRNRQAALRVEQQRQELIDLITKPREVTDKPAHMPSSLARQRRVHTAPRR